MDVLSVRDQLVADYRAFTGSFVTTQEERVREHMARRTAGDYRWPDPSCTSESPRCGNSGRS